MRPERRGKNGRQRSHRATEAGVQHRTDGRALQQALANGAGSFSSSAAIFRQRKKTREKAATTTDFVARRRLSARVHDAMYADEECPEDPLVIYDKSLSEGVGA